MVFASVGNGIFQTRADGASLPLALTHSQTFQSPASFTPDGRRLAYVETLGGVAQLWTVSLTEEGDHLKAGAAERFLTSSASDGYPSFSPDGRWLAYTSTEAGAAEVFVRAYPQPASGSGGRWQSSTNGGTAAVWSRDGHDFFHQAGDQIGGRLCRDGRYVRTRQARRVPRRVSRRGQIPSAWIWRRTASASHS